MTNLKEFMVDLNKPIIFKEFYNARVTLERTDQKNILLAKMVIINPPEVIFEEKIILDQNDDFPIEKAIKEFMEIINNIFIQWQKPIRVKIEPIYLDGDYSFYFLDFSSI